MILICLFVPFCKFSQFDLESYFIFPFCGSAKTWPKRACGWGFRLPAGFTFCYLLARSLPHPEFSWPPPPPRCLKHMTSVMFACTMNNLLLCYPFVLLPLLLQLCVCVSGQVLGLRPSSHIIYICVYYIPAPAALKVIILHASSDSCLKM